MFFDVPWCLSHQILFNKLLSTTSIPKDYTVCNITEVHFFGLSKEEKEIDSFYYSKKGLKEK